MASNWQHDCRLFRSSLALALGACLALTGETLAQTPAPDEASRGVSMLASHAPGGGYDAYARLYARHAGKHLPGQPSVTVRNMPGAAGVIMANHIHSQAARNGAVIGLAPGAIATAALFESPGARYDAREFTWIGSLNNDVSVIVSRADSPVKNLQDLFSKELIVGGAGASDNSVVHANILSRMFDAKLKLVSGYNGSGANVLALERGEVQGIAGWNYTSVVTMKPDWIRDKHILILLQMSLSRHKDLPDTQTILDLARNDNERKILQLIFTQSVIGRVVFAPPNIPAAQTKIMRAAFDKVLLDKDFLADAAKSRLEINGPLSGEKTEALIADLHRTPAPLVRDAIAILGKP